MLNEGQVVYHVANPKVSGRIVEKVGSDCYVGIEFDEPVGFSGNPNAGKRVYWRCSIYLLWLTSDQALLHNNVKELT